MVSKPNESGEGENDDQDHSANASNTTLAQNEDKVKEMWEKKLLYAACRARTSVLFEVIQKVFCVFTAVSYLNKSFYQ